MWNGKKKFNAVRVDTLIGKGTVITGGVSFVGGLHVDGRVQGNVTAGDTSGTMLVLSENGAIEGEVHAPNIVLNGTVDGDVHSSEHLELAANAKIRGDVYYNLLEMAVGAEVNGNLVHRKGGKLQLEDRRNEQPAADVESDS
ncbi:bactofilin family protein [Acidihalobacter prosperus]|uniref:Cell shape determination protein CcmA n=1 Tax=Acidihalobacter prosperus TaxID=160660 RepID=A0A1A6C209_9GAMM|nr:polymer-forming cytoskeletal protein [Acidihalobacter prosperus]OBS08585.1 hypothetical protein Thpro_022835 [Acidihalobacter prosperus]